MQTLKETSGQCWLSIIDWFVIVFDKYLIHQKGRWQTIVKGYKYFGGDMLQIHNAIEISRSILLFPWDRFVN